MLGSALAVTQRVGLRLLGYALSSEPNLQTVFSSELVRLESRILALRQNAVANLQLFDTFFAACQFVDLNQSVFDLAVAIQACC